MMKLNYIEEPFLEFGRGTHICPRAGITEYDVYDIKIKTRRDKILVGAVGTSDNLAKLDEWINQCSTEIAAKPDSRQPNLFPKFCGFNQEIGFKAILVLEDEIKRTILKSEIREIIKINNANQRVEKAVELYYEQIKFLAQNRNVDVIVCVIPIELYPKIAKQEITQIEDTLEPENHEIEDIETNFRRALKARTMHLGKPLQLIKEESLTSNKKQQDDATKAWNFCTAIYYKANNKVPWKLLTNPNQPSTCFIGISFYRSRDKKILNTSLAQLFDELGNSIILRGTPVEISKDDRQPHLKSQQAYQLLKDALKEYENALSNSPGRLVIHKSSNYNDAELEGFRQASNEMRIKMVDFVTILDTDMRLFRDGNYPPYRGTHIELDEKTHLLYTRGSVEYYKTYTGRYIPQPLEVRIIESDESAQTICQEILSLSKMNWNNTQFDGKYPITLRCARSVGQIMKYLNLNETPQVSYSFYM